MRFKNEHKTQEILNSERRELSTRNCLGIFSKENREIDEFQLKVTVDLQRPNFAKFFFCVSDIAKASI